MYNSLDKQSVKQNTPIVAIGGCGQEWKVNMYDIIYVLKSQ